MMKRFDPASLLLLTVSPMILAQSAAELPVVDIFAVRSWEPPPVVSAEATPAPPKAPPLPFRYLGRIVAADRGPAYLLAHGSSVVVVVVGDLVGKDYRVEKYESGRLVFRYRPMNLRQTLDLREKK